MARYMITGVGVYGFMLVLNPMMGNTENCKEFGPFDTKEQLMDFYNAEKVELYKDTGPNTFEGGTKVYNKSFKKGGPLEWMNPLWEGEFEKPNYNGHGIHECLLRVENAVKQGTSF